MADSAFNRKLAAILSADVEGYSRLMDDDEEATVRTLNSYRSAITDLVQQFRGRIVDAPGDNILSEFKSVVDAVNCAVEIQRDLAERNTELIYNRKMEFRIGINLGDVIEDDGRIYGDGVNIAARVESMSEAGGICISGIAYDQVANKLGLEYENLGEHQVKNISRPIRIYRVLSFPGAAAHRVIQAKETVRRRWFKISVSITAALVAAVLLLGIWLYYNRRPIVEPASEAKMAFPLPEKPSIAVLPFTNMSGDPEQEYFCDGITEDLITDLSKISNLFVIGRNSVFNYKGKTIKPSQVAEELGVRYILEGSARKNDNQVRINAQLIDTLSGGHLWAERYDGNMTDVFKLQDTVNKKIVTALAVKLTSSDEDRFSSKGTLNIEAYDIFLKGMAHYRKGTVDDIKLAISYFEKAIDLDPNYSRAYAALAAVFMNVYKLGGEYFITGVEYKPRLRAEELIQESLKNPTPLSYQVAAAIQIEKRMHGIAIDYANQAIMLDPNDPESYYALAMSLAWSGKAKEALEYINYAMRLDPYYPSYYLFVSGLAYFIDERDEEAAGSFERLVNRNPDHTLVMPFLVACYSYLDRVSEAKAELDRYSKRYNLDPIFLLGTAQFYSPFKEDKDLQRLADGFQMAMED